MEKTYKNSYRFYTAWNYEREIEDLNRFSETGWQLLRGGCFHNRFRWNPGLRYRYQLDYRKVEDMGRYIETFREQGWEYVNSTFNGWHYFRKLYDPALPESDYEIFTDRESLREMRGRWERFALILSAFLGAFAVVALVRELLRPTLPALVQFLTLALESGWLLRGALLMRDEGKKSRRGDSLIFGLMLAVILAGCSLGIVLTERRPNFQSDQRTEEGEATTEPRRFLDFQVYYRDNYYLNLEIEADQPLTFSVEDEEGTEVYSLRTSACAEKDIRLPLAPGSNYWFTLSDYAGGAYRINCVLS